MNEKFVEFFKDPSAYIKKLLQASLDEKWFTGSRSRVFSPCPFCDDALDGRCVSCLCPPEICEDHGFSGMVDDLIRAHDNEGGDRRHVIRVIDLTRNDLHKMYTLFKARMDDLDCCD